MTRRRQMRRSWFVRRFRNCLSVNDWPFISTTSVASPQKWPDKHWGCQRQGSTSYWNALVTACARDCSNERQTMTRDETEDRRLHELLDQHYGPIRKPIPTERESVLNGLSQLPVFARKQPLHRWHIPAARWGIAVSIA